MDYVRPGDAAGRDGIEPHNALPDPSARNGSTAGAEASQSGLSTRKYRHQHRDRSLFPVDGGAIHQMERELRAERAAGSRTSAKPRGKTGGRPRTDVVKLRDAKVLYENYGRTADEVCKVIGVGRRIFFAYLA
jgi:hypothetical protein